MKSVYKLYILAINFICLVIYLIVFWVTDTHVNPYTTAFFVLPIVYILVSESLAIRKKRKREKEEEKRREEHLQNTFDVSSEGVHHLCFRGNDAIRQIEECFDLKLKKEIARKGVDHYDLYRELNGSDFKIRFCLLSDIRGWNYIVLPTFGWDFKDMIAITKLISEKLNTQVNYYFCDGVVSIKQWIFAEKGIITRAYGGDWGVTHSEGYSEEEEKIREEYGDDGWSIFWALYEKTAQPIEYIDSLEERELDVYMGAFNYLS